MDEAKHDIQRRWNLYRELVALSLPNPMPASPPASGAISANGAGLTDRRPDAPAVVGEGVGGGGSQSSGSFKDGLAVFQAAFTTGGTIFGPDSGADRQAPSERKPGNLLVPEAKSAMLTAKDEERIRRAVRHAVRCTRGHDTDHHIEYLWDLVPHLKDAANAIACDEATLALSEIIGAD